VVMQQITTAIVAMAAACAISSAGAQPQAARGRREVDITPSSSKYLLGYGSGRTPACTTTSSLGS